MDCEQMRSILIRLQTEKPAALDRSSLPEEYTADEENIQGMLSQKHPTPSKISEFLEKVIRMTSLDKSIRISRYGFCTMCVNLLDSVLPKHSGDLKTQSALTCAAALLSLHGHGRGISFSVALFNMSLFCCELKFELAQLICENLTAHDRSNEIKCNCEMVSKSVFGRIFNTSKKIVCDGLRTRPAIAGKKPCCVPPPMPQKRPREEDDVEEPQKKQREESCSIADEADESQQRATFGQKQPRYTNETASLSQVQTADSQSQTDALASVELITASLPVLQPISILAETSFQFTRDALDTLLKKQMAYTYILTWLEADGITVKQNYKMEMFPKDPRTGQRVRGACMIGLSEKCHVRLPEKTIPASSLSNDGVFLELQPAPESSPQLCSVGGVRLVVKAPSTSCLLPTVLGVRCKMQADLLSGMSFTIGSRVFLVKSQLTPFSNPAQLSTPVRRLFRVTKEGKKTRVAFATRGCCVLFGSNPSLCAALLNDTEAPDVIAELSCPEVVAELTHAQDHEENVFHTFYKFDPVAKKYVPSNESITVKVGQVFCVDPDHSYVVEMSNVIPFKI